VGLGWPLSHPAGVRKPATPVRARSRGGASEPEMPVVQHRSRIYDPVEVDAVGEAATRGDGGASLTVLLAQAAASGDGTALQAWAAQALKKRLDGDGEGRAPCVRRRARLACGLREPRWGGPT